MDPTQDLIAYVFWPSAPLTDSLVRKALLSLPIIDSTLIYSTRPQSFKKLVQWSTYDELDHSLICADRHDVLSSSYVIRKALIRKHFLSHCIRSYLIKHPDSVLRIAAPKTWEIEIAFADELDDLWVDELWDLSNILDKSSASPDSAETSSSDRWWILKPGMADRGMGIRLFNSKQSLRQILDDFDDDGLSEDADTEGASDENNTSIVISQLRHFVIQASGVIAHLIRIDGTFLFQMV
jgi:tubulin---tyrosine ligase